jgi:prevent-host-death family protein
MTMKSVAISTFKAHCLALLENVARTGEPLLVTKRGKPLARVMSSDNSRSISPQDTLWGTVETVGDIIAPVVPPSAWNAARGVMLTQDEHGSAREQGRRRTGRRRARS